MSQSLRTNRNRLYMIIGITFPDTQSISIILMNDVAVCISCCLDTASHDVVLCSGMLSTVLLTLTALDNTEVIRSNVQSWLSMFI